MTLFVAVLLIEIHSLPVSLKAYRLPKMRSGNADFYSQKTCCFNPYATLCLPPPTVFANQG
jgi:hypothetical protein